MTTVIKRELLDHLVSIQFMLLLIISVVLFTVNGLVFVDRYGRQTAWYTQNVRLTTEKPSTVSTRLYAQPSPLLFMSEGGDRHQPAGYDLKPMGVLAAIPAEPGNYKMPEIPAMDWSFMIKILFSLYVLLVGYDAISGEKEQGTLRELLSHPVGRMKLLAAKYAAIMLTVVIPLFTGILISLIILDSSISTLLSPGVISRMLLIVFLALLYLSLFAFLSLLLSSLIHQSSLVLLTLLVVWVLFAILIPNLSGILSEEFSSVPSEYQVAKQLGPMIQKQVWGRISTILKRTKSGELKTEEEVKGEADRAFSDGQKDLIRLYESYDQTMRDRAALARGISRVSPTALFQYASEDVAATGIHREERFIQDATAYASQYDQYILKKVGKLVGVSNWSFMTGTEVNGKQVMIRSPFPEEYQGDKSDFPRFVERPPSLSEGIRNGLSDSVGLILWNVVLAAAGFVAIARSDVR
jgi:ABC-type transport system involved in multi-copper enzyme maturation permease subunit